MTKPKNLSIFDCIYLFRGQRVMLDSDLAQLYQVAPKVLNQSVRRNLARFPEEFMFQLNLVEYQRMRSQSVTASRRNLRHSPLAFTEHGIAMLSSVLQSERAIQVNIAIIKAFVKLRHALHKNSDLISKVERIEGKVNLLDTDIRLINEDIQKLKNLPERTGPQIKGFTRP